VDLSEPTRAFQVVGPQDGPFAQVWAEVVDQHASFYVLSRSLPAVNAQRTHQLRG
jgi:hypothetical protein